MLESTTPHGKSAFSHSSGPTVIVGGGPSGLLTALKLSFSGASLISPENLYLLEASSHLGGRLFFSDPKPLGTDASLQKDGYLSRLALGAPFLGPGWSAWDPVAQDSFLRHVENHLTPQEKEEWDSVDKSESSDSFLPPAKCIVFKKESFSLKNTLKTGGELFSKKDLERWEQLFLIPELVETSQGWTPHKWCPDPKTTVGESKFWQEVSKESKTPLWNLMELVLGMPMDDTPLIQVCRNWKMVLAAESAAGLAGRVFITKWQRKNGAELFLENCLKNRGVNVLTNALVTHLTQEAAVPNPIEKGAPKLRLQWSGGAPLGKEDTTGKKGFCSLDCERVIWAAPLWRSLGIMPREAWHSQTGKFFSKTNPVSAVFLEVQSASLESLWNHWEWNPLDRILFPQEGVEARVTEARTLCLMVSMGYEESLQAPAVREGISRMRKALGRILGPSYQKADSPVSLWQSASQGFKERIILLPVAKLPVSNPSLSHQQVKGAWKGLFFVGEGFTWGQHPWENVVESVRQTCAQLGLDS
jgi:hypothetical protein